MDRAVQGHLSLAEQHVFDADRLVLRQRELVWRMARDGHDTSTAEQLLREFEHSLALFKADRDLIRREQDRSDKFVSKASTALDQSGH